ncbi:conserved hypothetical protein [Candidatus Sulfotelmatomonas gaucii]|uniref:Uncharacterized protein n=1 Tax=Candidatus Sulfuritelmatomonas gaucii TaxID=2043161 RepID=A0A2N9LJ51_9BACT|nr:conserved hypothetical protein [Candidatus Sulfotelmatomonas gaucii]
MTLFRQHAITDCVPTSSIKLLCWAVNFWIDNRHNSVFDLVMQRKQSPLHICAPAFESWIPQLCSAILSGAVTLAFSLLTTGCLSPLEKHATAFSQATATVIDGSEDAYNAAMRLRLQEQASASVYAYDKDPSWSPYKDLTPLLTPAQLDARIKVLEGVKAYADTLVDLTSGKPSPDLENAAESVGTNLQGLNQTVATDFSTAIPNIPVMSTTQANQVSTAVLALGEYLISRKVKSSLPKVTQDMNPSIQTLCEVLNSDVVILRRQADVDYQMQITQLDHSIRNEGTSVSPYEHRLEIRTLIELADQQKANDELLARLQAALHALAMTHQALATAAQGNNPESISQKIAELAAAGHDLNVYYKSLPNVF